MLALMHVTKILTATLTALMVASGAAAADRATLRAARAFDKDRSRSIDATELAALNDAFAVEPASPLAQLDTNKDGKVSSAEMGVLDLKPKVSAYPRQFDNDKNHSIDGTEVLALRKEFEAATDGPVRALDRNHDGKLGDDEIAKFNERLAKNHERRAERANTTGATTSAAASAQRSNAAREAAAPTGDTASDTATLSWQRPLKNDDGSTIENLSGYVIKYGKNPGSLDRRIVVNDPKVTTYEFKNLSDGTWYFSITSVTSAGVESVPSRVLAKRIVARK
jgi:hypothetical protein